MSAAALRYIPLRTNLVLTAVAAGAEIACFVFAPAVWAFSPWAFAGLVVLFMYVTMLGWLLIHEAIHMKLATPRTLNNALGRLLAILFGCPFDIVRIGHMAHHRYNRRDIDTTELMPPDTRHPWAWTLAYYARILGGLYVSEILAPLFFFLWTRARRFVRQLSKSRDLQSVLDLFTRPVIRAIRIDALIEFALLGVLFWAYGQAFWLLLTLFAARALIVSYYDNAYHYGTDAHDVTAALNLASSPLYRTLMLNHTMHRIHHRYPVASWSRLPDLFREDGDHFDRSVGSVVFDQLKGPVVRPPKPA